jgi:hypothetical protein
MGSSSSVSLFSPSHRFSLPQDTKPHGKIGPNLAEKGSWIIVTPLRFPLSTPHGLGFIVPTVALVPSKRQPKTIRRHWSGVLHWYDSKINNGILEGLNSLVQATKAKARGYSTFKNFIYMIAGKLDYTKVGLPT